MNPIDRNIAPEYHSISQINIPDVKEIKLDNGIPLYLLSGGSQPVVKTDIIIKAGASYSPLHFVPHLTALMLHEGTKSRSAMDLAEQFDFLGAYFQAMSDRDHAYVNLFSLVKHTPKSLALLTESLVESTFPLNELETLIARQRQKFQVEEEKTSYLARINFFEQLFGSDHPYGRSNKLEYFDAINKPTLEGFYKQNYQAENMRILLSGQVDDALLSTYNKVLGAIPTQGSKNTSIPLKQSKSELLRVIDRKDAVQSSIRMGIATVTQNHKDYQGLKILGTILGGYFGSRLMKNIREEKGLTYGIYAMQSSLQQAGYLVVGADVKAEHTKEAIEEVKKEIDRLRNEPVPEEELQLVRNFMMGELIQMLDGPIETSEAVRGLITFGQQASYFNQIKTAILGISAKEIQHLANKYLNLDEFVVTVAGKYN